MINPVETVSHETMNRCVHFKTVLITDDVAIVHNAKASRHDAKQDSGLNVNKPGMVTIKTHLLFNEEGILQGAINFDAEYYDQSPKLKDFEEAIERAKATCYTSRLQWAKTIAERLNKDPLEPPTRLIYLLEQEGDSLDYYKEYQKLNAGYPFGFVTRCKPDPDRKVLVTGKNGADKLTPLMKHMESRPMLGQGDIFLGRKPEKVGLRASRVKIVDPNDPNCHTKPLLEVTCVLACFMDNPDKKWLLTSSEGPDQTTMEDALKIVSHYAKRANVYDYYKLLKMNVYHSDITSHNDLQTALAQILVYPLTAYRILQFILMANYYPDRDASAILMASEFAGLVHLLKSKDMDFEKILSKDAKDFAENFLNLPYESVYRPVDMTVKEIVLLLGKVQGIDPTIDLKHPDSAATTHAMLKSYAFIKTLGRELDAQHKMILQGYEF